MKTDEKHDVIKSVRLTPTQVNQLEKLNVSIRDAVIFYIEHMTPTQVKLMDKRQELENKKQEKQTELNQLNKELQQINEEIESFVSNCVLADGNTSESTESITSILNNDEVSGENKTMLVFHNSTIFEDVKYVATIEYKNALYESNKVKPTLANIDYYLTYNTLTSIDETLVKYINANVQEYIEQLKGQDFIQENKRIIKCLIAAVGIDKEIWETIFTEVNYSQCWSDNVLELREEQVRYLADNKLLDFIKIGKIRFLRYIISIYI